MTADVTKKPDLRLIRTMPEQKPGKSKQDYATPWSFIRALERRFGKIELDLAATKDNAKAPLWITPEQDSLSQDWDMTGGACAKLAFLNPPFNACADFARKCARAERLPILFLVPASVGSEWWAREVDGKADLVLFVRPRIEFEGLPCARRKGKVQFCQHDASEHRRSGEHPDVKSTGMCAVSGCGCVGFKKDPYPKDCAVALYNGPEHVFIEGKTVTRYECWNYEVKS